MMKKYKYIHVFWHNELKFSDYLIDTINNDKENFDLNDHLFITTHKGMYDYLSARYENVEYYKSDISKPAKLVNSIGDFADLIILHSVCDPNQFIKIKKRYLKKTIVRYWGGNTFGGYSYSSIRTPKDIMKNIVFFGVNVVFKKRINLLKGIGIACVVDEIELSRDFKHLNYYIINYISSKNRDVIKKIGNVRKKKDDNFNILVGHSGFSTDQHIRIVDDLSHLFDNPIKLYLMLSYGNEKYIEQVKNYIQSNDIPNVVIVDEYMDYEKYIEFLLDMDAAIFATDVSNALGNISTLLRLKKKLFLNDQGSIAKAFDHCDVPYYSFESLANISYEDLIKPTPYDDDTYKKIFISTYEQGVEYWKRVLELV